MSKITYTKDDKVVKREGEFYEVDSCYTTPRSVHTADSFNDPIFAALALDVDELMNKPRRFFDHLLSVIEYQRDNDPIIDQGNHRERWQHLIEGCEIWLSAVNNGLYGEVVRLAEPVVTNKKRHLEMLEDYEVRP